MDTMIVKVSFLLLNVFSIYIVYWYGGLTFVATFKKMRDDEVNLHLPYLGFTLQIKSKKFTDWIACVVECECIIQSTKCLSHDDS